MCKNSKKTNSRVIKIDEQMARMIKEEVEVTEYKFIFNVKNFLAELLDDPVNAQPSFFLKQNGFDRNRLIRDLLSKGILEKNNRISDKDEEGNYKTAVMKVRYKVPKENIKYKLKKYYIENFENDNLVSDSLLLDKDKHMIEEEGEAMAGATTCGDSSGQYTQPLFGKPIKRRPYTLEGKLYTVLQPK